MNARTATAPIAAVALGLLTLPRGVAIAEGQPTTYRSNLMLTRAQNDTLVRRGMTLQHNETAVRR